MSWTFPHLGETMELNDESRASAPGSFALLSSGYTHYELCGSETGQPVVLVHGFSVPYFIWDPTFAFLTNSGFRVLRYDLIGRGYSDKPRIRYDLDLFCKQLTELLDTLGLERFNLIGLSLGGPISSTFTTRHPERVRKLALIDPAGVRPVVLPKAITSEILPVMGELVSGLFSNKRRTKEFASDFYNPANIKVFVRKYMVQVKYKGFAYALLSTMRNGMLGDFSSTYHKIGELGLPTLLFWGRNDKTVPFEYSDDLRAAIPQMEFHAFENCGHIPHYEKPDEANPILLEFLK
jgi:pimeloyl-ACP methyl ester carboxylesterase